MKKMLLELSLAVAALCLFLPPAMAVSPPQAAPALGAADQAFLASLAALAKAPGAPAPQLAAKRPHIGAKSACTASANCWDVGTVNCSGSGSCSAVDGNCSWGEPGHVTCDGVTTWCSPCPDCGPDWCSGESDCAAQCSAMECDYVYTCNGYPACSDNCRCRPCYY